MGSLVVRLDGETQGKLRNRWHYSDIDMLSSKGTFGGTAAVPMVYDVEAVKMSVRNILTWRVGESVLRPEFGHNLNKSMYAQMDTYNQDKVAQEVQRAIEENEPRVEVVSVSAKRGDEHESSSNTLHVKVSYKVIGNKGEDAEFVEEAKISGR